MSESNKFYKDIASELGRYGTIYAGPGSTSTGPFSKAIFVTSGTMVSVTASGITNSSQISSGTTFAANSVFAGTIETVKVKTGAMMLYKKGT